ncbi:MAG: universal stress protein [Pirellulales bacterium]|nr:universal stress protein [Pirellulales bacterium]
MASDGLQRTPEQFVELIRRQQRGRLKIYLGFAAGVGKTYEMLLEGQRLKRQGIDVVVGMVETHGRAETAAQIGDLELMPRRKIQYHGVELEELDVDALLQRHPTVVLIDELAHTNAPGSRNSKRYQDVEELLRAGIHVIATLNIQHLESLHDIVEQATGVRVKERIPDYVVGMADQLINVDVSAEDLRERLQAGKIYPADRIQTALDNFFQLTHLNQLRELAMKEIAHRLGQHTLTQTGPTESNQSERIAVALSSRSPNSAMLLRKASRLADRFDAPWYAVYVQTPQETIHRTDAATQRQVSNALALARQLGGTPLEFKGTDVPSTIAAFVKEYGISHLVLGRTQRPWYQRWFGRSTLNQLLRKIPNVDVVVVESSGEA